MKTKWLRVRCRSMWSVFWEHLSYNRKQPLNTPSSTTQVHRSGGGTGQRRRWAAPSCIAWLIDKTNLAMLTFDCVRVRARPAAIAHPLCAAVQQVHLRVCVLFNESQSNSAWVCGRNRMKDLRDSQMLHHVWLRTHDPPRVENILRPSSLWDCQDSCVDNSRIRLLS